MTLFYISGHRKFKTKSRKVMKYEKTLVNFKPFFEFFDIWVPITFRDKELMVWNFEFPSFLLCPTIPFLPFWAIRKTGQIISIWTQFQQMLKIIEIAHIYFFFLSFLPESVYRTPIVFFGVAQNNLSLSKRMKAFVWVRGIGSKINQIQIFVVNNA